MDINQKLQRFGQSLEDASYKEYMQIQKKVDEEIKLSIEQEIKEYEEKKQVNYEKNVQRIEKDYNKKVFNYEINCKKQIIDEERKMKEMIKLEASNSLREFTKSEQYQEFLLNSIKERLRSNWK